MAKFITDHDFYCCKCGSRNQMGIVRVKGKERAAGHLKKIFCLTCHKEWNHAECVPYSRYAYKDFLIEFDYKNFDENGNRIFEYGKLKDLINKGKLKISEGDTLSEEEVDN